MLLAQELDSRIQQLQDSYNSTFQRVKTIEDLAEMNATMRVYQQVIQEISVISSRLTQVQTSSQQNTASISSLQLQSAQNDTVLDARLDSHVGSSNTAHQQLNHSIVMLLTGQYSAYPASSCDDLPISFPAGNYYILSATGSALRQYCPSITTRCGQTGRWRQVIDLNMDSSSHQCYSAWSQPSYTTTRLCARSSDSRGCSSSGFLSTDTPYRSVCGLVRAYQFGTPDAFYPSGSSNNIDSIYVDGVSITHGSPRQHIWTFAAASSPTYYRDGCPCMGGNNNRPAFVENDYFCNTGRTSTGTGHVFYGSNPLWDGAGCGSGNNCCSFNTPPWFYRELPQYSYTSLEIRLCRDATRSDEDIALRAATIYVK